MECNNKPSERLGVPRPELPRAGAGDPSHQPYTTGGRCGVAGRGGHGTADHVGRGRPRMGGAGRAAAPSGAAGQGAAGRGRAGRDGARAADGWGRAGPRRRVARRARMPPRERARPGWRGRVGAAAAARVQGGAGGDGADGAGRNGREKERKEPRVNT